jgi:hypothetical protein
MKRKTKRKIIRDRNSPGRALLISNVVSYNKHLKGKANGLSNYELLQLCNPSELETLAKGVNYYVTYDKTSLDKVKRRCIKLPPSSKKRDQ